MNVLLNISKSAKSLRPKKEAFKLLKAHSRMLHRIFSCSGCAP